MLEEIKNAIAEQLSCSVSEIGLETSFKEDLGADSLDLYELIMALEEKYNLEIPPEELTNMELETVEDVVSYLKSKGIDD